MKATRNISSGETILSEKAFASVVDDSKLVSSCSRCFFPSSKMCSGCSIVTYCTLKCQSKDWKNHKLECHVFNSVKPRKLFTFLRLFLRILILKLSNRIDYEKILLLKDHLDLQGADKIDSARQFAALLLNSLSINSFTLEEAVSIFFKFTTNSITIYNENLDSLGVGVYENISFINHSCNPNSASMSRSGKIVLRAIKNIKQGDEITINYIDIASPSEKRQFDLKERYHFTCTCEICCENDLLTEMEFNTLDLLSKQQDELKSMQNWTECFKVSEKLFDLMSRVYPENHPVLVIQQIMIAKLTALGDETSIGFFDLLITRFGNVLKKLEITHGLESYLYKEIKECHQDAINSK